jgi:hypothetical protein
MYSKLIPILPVSNDAVHALALGASLTVIEAPTLQQWGRKTMVLESPNGYRVGFEEATS